MSMGTALIMLVMSMDLTQKMNDIPLPSSLQTQRRSVMCLSSLRPAQPMK